MKHDKGELEGLIFQVPYCPELMFLPASMQDWAQLTWEQPLADFELVPLGKIPVWEQTLEQLLKIKEDEYRVLYAEELADADKEMSGEQPINLERLDKVSVLDCEIALIKTAILNRDRMLGKKKEVKIKTGRELDPYAPAVHCGLKPECAIDE